VALAEQAVLPHAARRRVRRRAALVAVGAAAAREQLDGLAEQQPRLQAHEPLGLVLVLVLGVGRGDVVGGGALGGRRGARQPHDVGKRGLETRAYDR
jgi:hypothetical protein